MGGPKEYAKFAAIITIITIVAWLLGDDIASWMRYFMATYLLVFGLFKLVDLKMFAHGFSEYDPIAMRSSLYAKLYPFIELGLSILFFANVMPALRNVLVVIIFGINLIGVVAHLNDKNKIRCACLGKFVNLPLTTITVTEDALMVAMAVAGLLM